MTTTDNEYSPVTPAIVTIDGVEYPVRNNYLHRGLNPRLVLNHKAAGKFVVIQANDNNDLCRTIMNDPKFFQEKFKGYWVDGNGHREIVFQVKNIKYLG